MTSLHDALDERVPGHPASHAAITAAAPHTRDTAWTIRRDEDGCTYAEAPTADPSARATHDDQHGADRVLLDTDSGHLDLDSVTAAWEARDALDRLLGHIDPRGVQRRRPADVWGIEPEMTEAQATTAAMGQARELLAELTDADAAELVGRLAAARDGTLRAHDAAGLHGLVLITGERVVLKPLGRAVLLAADRMHAEGVAA